MRSKKGISPFPGIPRNFIGFLGIFFYQRADPGKTGQWDYREARAVREIPHHLTCGGNWSDLVVVLTDLLFMELKISLGMEFDLISDYSEATGTGIFEYDGISTVREFQNFLKKNLHILRKNPKLTLQQAANFPEFSAPSVFATLRLKDRMRPVGDGWVQWVNKPDESDPCKMIISGFSDGITCVKFSPDGKLIACASRDCVIYLLNSETSQKIETLYGHSGWIVSMDFSRDGQTLVSASWDHSLIVWSIPLAQPITSLTGHHRRVSACEYSPSSGLLASSSWDGTIKIWHTKNPATCSKTITTGDSPINSLAFSPCGKFLAIGTWEGNIKIYSAESGRNLGAPIKHGTSIRSLAYSPSGTRLVSGSADGLVFLWDVFSRNKISQLAKHKRGVTCVGFSKSGSHVISVSEDNSAEVWRSSLGKEIQKFRTPEVRANCCTFGPEGTTLFMGTEECYVIVWDISSGMEIWRKKEHVGPIFGIKFSGDQSKFVTCSEDGTAMIWELVDSEEWAGVTRLVGHGGAVTGVSWDPSSKYIATSSDDFSVKIWNSLTGELFRTLTGHSSVVRGVFFSENKIFSASRDNSVRVWDYLTGETLHVLLGHMDWVNCLDFYKGKLVTGSWDYNLHLLPYPPKVPPNDPTVLRGHAGAVSCCSFSPSGKLIASASFDGTVRIWDVDSGVELTVLPGTHGVRVNWLCWAPDDRLAAVSDDQYVRVWYPLTTVVETVLAGHSAPVRTAVFSPTDDNRLVTAGDDRQVKIWDLSDLVPDLENSENPENPEKFGDFDEMEESEFFGHSGRVNSIRLSRDGTELVTAGEDGALHLWDMKLQKKIRSIFRDIPSGFHSCDFSSQDHLLVAAAGKNVLFWDLRDPSTDKGEEGRVLVSHGGAATSCSICSDGFQVVSTGWDGKILISDLRLPGKPCESEQNEEEKGNPIMILEDRTEWLLSAEMSPDRKHVISGGWNNTINIWNTSDGSIQSTLEGHTQAISKCTYSENGKYIASASHDTTVKLWNAGTGKMEKLFSGHSDRINHVAFVGHTLISAGNDSVVQIWDSRGTWRNEFFCQAPVVAVDGSQIGGDLNVLCGDTMGTIYHIRVNRLGDNM